MVIGDPNKEDTTVGATISPQQASIVLNYIQGARAEVRFWCPPQWLVRSGVNFAFDAGLFLWRGLGFFSQRQAFSADSYCACAVPVCSHLH